MQVIRSIRVLAMVMLVIAGVTTSARGDSPTTPIRIGVISDMSGHLADMSGPATVEAVRMAVADFGGTVLGRSIEVLAADHQNKPDIGLAIVRKWYDRDNVGLVLDVNSSALALAVQQLTRDRNRIVVFGGAFSTDLTGKDCSPNGIAWVTDSYSQTNAVVAQQVHSGLDTWFILTPDYAFGFAAQRDVEAAVAASGGKVVGSLRVPAPVSDISSYVVQAQASGAKVVELLQGGNDLQAAIKTAHEFGLGMPGNQQLSTFIFWLTDATGLGLEASQGLWAVNAFYWDQTDATRVWSQRFFQIAKRMPDAVHAGMYGATMHYLKAMQAAGTTDTAAVLAKMKSTPVNDFMTSNARIREDGRLMRDMYVYQVKAPAASKNSWDVFRTVARIPANQAARPLAETNCPLVKE